MVTVKYEIVEHDGGWAYKVGDALSETFPSHEAALKAATAVVSVVTAIVLWPLVRRSLKLPGPAQMRAANEALQIEIAERKRIEEELRIARDAAEASLDTERTLVAAIVQSSGDAIIGKTLDGIVTSWNAAAENIFGYRADEMIGRPLLVVIPPALAYGEAGSSDHQLAGATLVFVIDILATAQAAS